MNNKATTTEIVKINKNVQILRSETNKIVIKNAEDMRGTVEFLNKIRSWKKRIEEIRLSYTQPLNESLKRINADFKRTADPLNLLDDEINGKMGEYRAKEAEKIRKQQEKEAEKQRLAFEKEQEKKRKELEKQKKKDDLTKKEIKEAEKEIEKEEFVPKPIIKQETTIKTDDAKMVARKSWTFEIEDETKIPRKYLKVDEVAIGKAVRSGGIREIKGVKIYQEENFGFKK